MARFHLAPPASLPMDVLFPEAYERSRRMVALDFLYMGIVTVSAVVLGAIVHLAVAA